MNMKLCSIAIGVLMVFDGILPGHCHSDTLDSTTGNEGVHQSLTLLSTYSSANKSANRGSTANKSLWEGGIFDRHPHVGGKYGNIAVAHNQINVGNKGPLSRDSAHHIVEKRELVDSSWDGYKSIRPANNPMLCVDYNGDLLTCSSHDNNDMILFKHDDQGRLISKYTTKCMTVTDDLGDFSFVTCNNSDAQKWIRTSKGQLKNKLIQKVLKLSDCSVGVTSTTMDFFDELDVEDGCDQFSVVGPHEHDPLDFGSVLFHQVGQDLAPAVDDNAFGSSVAIDDKGDIVVVGGSVSSVNNGNEVFFGTVTIYAKTGSIFGGFSWTQKDIYELNDHVSSIKPKVTVTVSGDAKRVAIAVSSNDDQGAIQALEYNESTSSLTTLGSTIDGDSSGEHSGLKLSMDKTGNTLVVGSPYYDNNGEKNAGRARVFDYVSDEDGYTSKTQWLGIAKDVRFGSAVSISSGGDLIAIGLEGSDNSNPTDNNGGAVLLAKLENGIWSLISQLRGESDYDEAGSSVKVVHISTSNKIRLAFGAIYNDGNGQVNSGHVRVFECDYANCDTWTKIGSDIDGDNGVVFDGASFHVGDAFGFSLDMSDDGERLVAGAPFHSASRTSDYYSGSVKLFEFSSDAGDWEQLGHDLIGDTISETSGYSVGMSRDGKTLVVGSPGDMKGTAQVYLQDEVSNMPSLAPSSEPSSEPSLEPSSIPTSVPSVAPSSKPTTTSAPSSTPSSDPSSQPSTLPTSRPSTVPSDAPSAEPSVSNAPSEKPSSSPAPSISIKPSAIPSSSAKPSISPSPSVEPSKSAAPSVSSRPSSLPSSVPSTAPTPLTKPPSAQPSTLPSSQPTVFGLQAFQIRTTYSRLADMVPDIDWCIEALFSGPKAKLNMRPCDGSDLQRWYHDATGRIRLEKSPEFAMDYQGRTMIVVGDTDSPVEFMYSEVDHTIYTERKTGKKVKKLLVGIDPEKIFSKLRVFKEGQDNRSINAWYFEKFGPSASPSTAPRIEN